MRLAGCRLIGWMHATGLIRVVVIDSDARVRRALEQLIDAEEGMEVLAAAAIARDARVELGRAAADVLLWLWGRGGQRAATKGDEEIIALLRTVLIASTQ